MKIQSPDFRFPEFINDWKEVRLNELLKESQKKNFDLKFGKEDVLSVSDDSGIVNQIEHLGRSYAGESVHNYPVVEVGDIVYTKSPLKDKPYGIIKINKHKSGIVSTLYAVYKCKENVCGEFLEYYFQLDDHTNKYLRPLVRKGAKNDMKINNSYVLNDKIFVPEKLEQQKIAAFLTKVDEKIQQLAKKKSLLQQYKKGVMQKIFNQETRFKDDNGNEFADWENLKLGDVTKLFSSRNRKLTDAKVYSVTNTKGFVLQSDQFDREIAGSDLTNYKIIERNDFAYNPARINVGSIAYFQEEVGIISSLYVCFRTTEKLQDEFLLHFLELDHTKYQISNLGEGGVRVYLWYDLFALIKIKLPSLPEQKKIANFLSAIDDKINSTNQQMEKTKKFKKALLQQMFI